jgi:hypothetical protein
MKITVLGITLCVFACSGCGTPSDQKITTKQEIEFKEVNPQSVAISGHWSAVWKDPVAGFSENFTMDLEQKGNKVEGTAAFVDSRRTKAVVSGQISGNKIHLVMKPDSENLHEVSWTGTVADNSVTGTWYLHGNPPSGMAASGPWQGSMEKE